MAQHTIFTPAIQETIVQYVRAGAYDYQAALAAGISKFTFIKWMARTDDPFVGFQAAVRQARAQARVAAEIQVRKERPEIWLMKGPGRERPGEPGWSDKQSIEVTAQVTTGPDYSRLSLAEMEQFDALYRKSLPVGSISGIDPATESDGEIVAGEVVSVRGPAVPSGGAPPEANSETGGGGTGGDKAPTGVDATATWEIVNE